jgi:hypothetical protein
MKLDTKEIELLAEDIRNNINQTIEIAKFSITGASLLLGYSLSRFNDSPISSGIMCLLPIPILLAAVEMIINRRQNIMEKSTFLRRFGNTNYIWELFLREYRRKQTVRSSFTKTIINMLKCMVWICILFSVLISIVVFFKHSPSTFFPRIFALDKSALVSLFMFTVLAIVTISMWVYFHKKQNNVNSVIMGTDNEDKTFDTWGEVRTDVKGSYPDRTPEE